MSARDYKFVRCNFSNSIYLARLDDSGNIIDKREVTEDEIIKIFEQYLKKYCITKNTREVKFMIGGKFRFLAIVAGSLRKEIKSEIEKEKNISD